MLRNRILLKAFATFFILEILTSTIVPTLSYALTAGPTAPEATSFEPVDTSDMVNLLTGDLIYNMPLFEVPGPAGGYPLSLSYHAGIQPNLESSWVGLGWTLNPGSISRLVNGYADDHKEVIITDRLYIGPTSQTTYNIGVTIPNAGPGSVTAGLTFNQYNNGGFSVSPYLMGSAQLIPGVGIQASSNGTASLTAPIINMMNMVSTGQFNYNFKGTDVGISKKGISISHPLLNGLAALDVSINSKQIKSKVGISGINKSVEREGKVNRVKKEVNIPIPIPQLGVMINLGRTYQRMWVNEFANVNTNGALNFPLTQPAYTYMNARGFDVYDLFSGDHTLGTPKSPEGDIDGTFPDYDQYSVNAQGLSGSMRPYHYYEYLYRQNRNNDGTPITRAVPLGATGNKVGFRFTNDFSNRFLFEPPSPTYAGSSWGITMSFNTGSITAGKDGEGYHENILAGSRHVEFFTNTQIVNDLNTAIQKGFIDCTAPGFTRLHTGTSAAQIGGFKITNESGVTYHFSLPVYSYDEYSRIEKIEAPTATYNEITKNTRYAHSWMLTAITGPDYIDRGGTNNAPNGKIDEADWGYWVEFGYRKWASDYNWRNPAEGFNKDLDNNFQNYSHGKKEIYYLDFVRTATHIALFDKSEKSDGKGVIARAGGFSTSSRTMAKLDNVYVLSWSDFASIGGLPILGNIPSNRTSIVSKSIRSIKFNYSYELVSKTLNSFDFSNINAKKGKLTLTSLKFLGNQEADVLPPVVFSYEVGNPKKAQVFLSKVGTPPKYTFYRQNTEFSVGDIVKFDKGSSYYGVITNINLANHIHDLLIFDGNTASLTSGNITITETKNPPHNKEMYDMWQMFKSDYQIGLSGDSRLTTPVSGKAVDVWSLRSIKTMLGASINIRYEPDYYDNVVLTEEDFDATNANQQALKIRDATKLSSTHLKVYFFNEGYNLNDLFAINEKFNLTIIGAYRLNDLVRVTNPVYPCQCPQVGYAHHENFSGTGIIESINPSDYSITIKADYLILSLSKSLVDVVDYTYICNGDIYSCGYSTQNWPSFIAGGVAFSRVSAKFGGGIRVKEIELNNLDKKQVTRYSYGSGVTSYEPVGIPAFTLNPDYYNNITSSQRAQEYEEATMLFKNRILKQYSKMLNLAREVPPPGVMYKDVEVRNLTVDEVGEHHFPHWQKFSFQTFEFDMLKYHKASPTAHSGTGSNPPSISGMPYNFYKTGLTSIDDLTAAIGNIKSIYTYDQSGKPIESTTYSYLHDAYLGTLATTGYTNYASQLALKHNSQGIIKESFADARVTKLNTSNILLGVTSKRRIYPSILTKQIQKNYKSGVEVSSEVLNFDFFSGEETRSMSNDGYGNFYVTETQPAYKKYVPMGLGMYGRKNMLSQVAAEYTYKVSPTNLDNKLALVAADVQTWSNAINVLDAGQQSNVWRKHKTYTFIGDETVAVDADGNYPISSFAEFTEWSGTNEPSSAWLKTNEATFYGVYSHTLGTSDVNNHKMATKLSVDQKQVLATVINSAYSESGYSGAEDQPIIGALGNYYFGGGVHTPPTPLFSSSAHSGFRSLFANTSNGIGFSYRSQATPNKIYRASVWSSQNTALIKYKVDGGTIQTPTRTVKSSGGWYLIEALIPLQNTYTYFDVWCEGTPGVTRFDDFRVHPNDAVMTSYVYDKWGEVSHVLDANNLFTRYEYNSMGKLVRTFKETLNTNIGLNGIVKISEIMYNYGNKNPYTVLLTTSVTGPSGNVSPLGPITVNQGGTTTIEIKETCTYPRLESVTIDGQLVSLGQGAVTLFDGAQVKINGKILTFSNLQANHTINAKFYESTGGAVQCRSTEQGACICYDGTYEYGYFNGCGEIETWYPAMNAAQVPQDLQHLVPTQSCTSMNMPGCNCQMY